MDSKLRQLQKQINAHDKACPKHRYNLDEKGQEDYRKGYAEDYRKWQDKQTELYNASAAEERAEEIRVLSQLHIPKGLASRLASHGFNERCYRSYYKRHGGLKKPTRYPHSNFGNNDTCLKGEETHLREEPYELWSPTYDQVAQWFTDNYQVDFISSPEMGRKKQYRCDPITPKDGLINLPLSDTVKEAQLHAFEALLSKLEPLPREVEEPEEDEDEMQDHDEVEPERGDYS